jgi:haloalkane dehalogenase
MSAAMTRHYLTINGRRVHYRRAGKGPPLLMIHQSPRSSAEYEELMATWGMHFTCIAPDTPGFGQSVPLADPAPEIDVFADAIVEFADALGLGPLPAYGFHSGAIILITALKRNPHAFRCVAAGGYAVWTAEERTAFGANYTPPFLPLAYGEHLVWGWNRILEQSWFFPWYDVRPEARLSIAHDDPQAVHSIVSEILDAGDAFRLGYGAVLRAPRDIPPPETQTPPVLITAYKADPLHAHLARMGTMPANWQAYGVENPVAQQEASLTFLKLHAGDSVESLPEDADKGFLPVKTAEFEGLIHWQGGTASARMIVHAPGREAELVAGDGLKIDLPGHGLSSRWQDSAPTALAPWQAVIDAVAAHFGIATIAHEPLPMGDPDRLYPDLQPDRFGHYLTTAWAKARAAHFFAPWYEASATNAISFAPADVAPEQLAIEHRALIRGVSAKAWHLARAHG